MGQRICVTGASGQAGRAVVADLREHGYDVIPTDMPVSRADCEERMLRADLTDFGQAVEALRGADAVVHLANIPAPGLETPAVTFNSNITMNHNVFSAAASLQKNVLDRQRWPASEQLRLAIITRIERTYHPRRRQHRLGRLTPIEYETINQAAHATRSTHPRSQLTSGFRR